MTSFPDTFPQLTTQRFLLRQLSDEDDHQIFLLRFDEQVNKYLERKKATVIEDAKEFIQKINNSFSNNEGLFWAICKKDETKLMGTICLWNINLPEGKAEV